jgi:hypothetical protein
MTTLNLKSSNYLNLKIKYIMQLKNIEDLICENPDKVDWYYVCSNQKLSEEFIREFSYKVDWAYISNYQKLLEKFIEEFHHKVYWEYIF